MALRQEDLLVREAIVYPFPAEMARRRAARATAQARRRHTLGVVAVGLATFLLAQGPLLLP